MALVTRLSLARRPASFSSTLLLTAALGTALALGGCASTSAYDQMLKAKPSGSPFARALYKSYALLAQSLGMADAPATTAFDTAGAISIAGVDSDVAGVGNAFAAKAITAAKGEEPLPEPAPTDNIDAENLRMKLLRALDQGRTKAPALAARTQAEYDCWVLDSAVDSLARSANLCRQNFQYDLTSLERAAPANAPAAAPTAPVETKPAAPPEPEESSEPDETDE